VVVRPKFEPSTSGRQV